jgi:transcriptional regulator with XRE-family HTH domain
VHVFTLAERVGLIDHAAHLSPRYIRAFAATALEFPAPTSVRAERDRVTLEVPMPRRKERDPLVIRLGKRLRFLRIEAKLSLARLVAQAKLSGLGYLSDVERGWSLPVILTQANLARALEVDLIDLVNFPEHGLRNELLEMTRLLQRVDPAAVEELMHQAEEYLRDPKYRS